MIAKFAAATVLVFAFGRSAAGAELDCDSGYQTFLGDFSKLVRTVAIPDATDALKKSLAVYDACKAGDAYAPEASWRAILVDLEQSKKE